MTEKTSDELKAMVSRNEACARYGAWAVVAGLVVEIFIAICFNNNETPTEKFSLVFANSLIALGVLAEILFGRKSLEAAEARSAILEKEAADARLRTAEIERLTAWRHVTPGQLQIIEGLFTTKCFPSMC